MIRKHLSALLALLALLPMVAWDDGQPPAPKPNVQFATRVVDDRFVVDITTVGGGLEAAWFVGSDKAAIRLGYTYYGGPVTGGSFSVDCHQFHGRIIEVRYTEPVVDEWWHSVECGKGFQPKWQVPPTSPDPLAVWDNDIPDWSPRPIPTPPRTRVDTATEVEVMNGWVAVRVRLSPADAHRWTTDRGIADRWGTGVEWRFTAWITRLPYQHRCANVGAYCGHTTDLLRSPAGLEYRFECGHGYDRVKISLGMTSANSPNNPWSSSQGDANGPWERTFTIPACDTEDGEAG